MIDTEAAEEDCGKISIAIVSVTEHLVVGEFALDEFQRLWDDLLQADDGHLSRLDLLDNSGRPVAQGLLVEAVNVPGEVGELARWLNGQASGHSQRLRLLLEVPLNRSFQVPFCPLQSHLRQGLEKPKEALRSAQNNETKSKIFLRKLTDLVCSGDSNEFVDSLLARLPTWDIVIIVGFGTGRRRNVHDEQAAVLQTCS